MKSRKQKKKKKKWIGVYHATLNIVFKLISLPGTNTLTDSTITDGQFHNNLHLLLNCMIYIKCILKTPLFSVGSF